MVTMTTLHSGFVVTIQSAMPSAAEARLILSSLVISFSPLNMAMIKTARLRVAATPIIHAPGPAPLAIWAAKVIALRMPQINQENVCGFVLPAKRFLNTG